MVVTDKPLHIYYVWPCQVTAVGPSAILLHYCQDDVFVLQSACGVFLQEMLSCLLVHACSPGLFKKERRGQLLLWHIANVPQCCTIQYKYIKIGIQSATSSAGGKRSMSIPLASTMLVLEDTLCFLPLCDIRERFQQS